MGAPSLAPIETLDRIVKRLSFALPAPDRVAIYQSVLEGSRTGPEYMGMLVLAALIALFGLLQNSEAVIIGAMLISPLMNPILSAALALLLGDGRLGRRSATILVLSIGGAIGITWLVSLLSPLKQATPQILARTNPNLLDLFIAFLSGLAGTLALRSSNTSLTIMPGVAIAVAVVPPLAVVGYGLSTHQGSAAGGAFLLFATNLVSIIISAALVFRLMGFRPHRQAEKGRVKLVYRMAISAGILLVLSIPLFQTLRKAVSRVGLRAEITNLMDTAFKTPHSSVADLSFSQTGSGLRVYATLRTTHYFETRQIDAAEESLRRRFGAGTKLDVDQLLVAQGGVNPEPAARPANVISGGVVRPVTQEAPFDFKLSGQQMVADLQKQLDQMLTGGPFQRLGDARMELSTTRPLLVRLELASPGPIDAQTVSLLSSQLSSRLSTPAEVHGEVTLNGPGYESSLEISSRNLTSQDRKNLAALAKIVTERPDLQLRITYVPATGPAGVSPWPPRLPDVEKVLAANGLKPSQWTVQPGREGNVAAGPASPSTGTKTGSAQPLAARGAKVRYEFHTHQLF
jgi:uncharacterized hydrophobic protein (TIGR00271 family)